MSPSVAGNKTRETIKTFWYFMGVQFFFAFLMVSFSLGGQTVFGILIAIPPLAAWVTFSRKGMLFILYFLCITFAVGQRTFYIGPYVRVVPSEMFMYLLAVSCLALRGQSALYKRSSIPWALLLLCVFSSIGIILATTKEYANMMASFNQSADLNLAFFYAGMMWMGLPAFWICGNLVRRFEELQNISTIFALICLFLSFLGLAEYFQWGFIGYFKGFTDANARDMMTGEGFHRLGATFWGGPMLAGFLTLCFPLNLAHFFSSRTTIQRIMVLSSLILSFLVIYYSGHRGLWISCLIGIACFFYLKGVKGIFILVLLAALGLQFAPNIAKERIQTLAGTAEDSSAHKRKGRAEDAWGLIKKSPVLGNGWGASGLVHSDLLQIWADAGIFTFGSFFILFVQIILRLFSAAKRMKNKIFREYSYGFIASLIGVFIVLMGQAWFNLPEQYAPFWLIMGLAYQYPNVILNEKRIAIQLEIEKHKMLNEESENHA